MELIAKLKQLGILSEKYTVLSNRTRDLENLPVHKDQETDVIYLSSTEHCDGRFQEAAKEVGNYTVKGQSVKTPKIDDNKRRYLAYGNMIEGKDWVDFGCGEGAVIKLAKHRSRSVKGVETNKHRIEMLKQSGIEVVTSLNELANESCDIITMFHVLEHLLDPVETLASCRRVLKKGGKMVIEVPHARDALISLYTSQKFMEFSFWSEHLVLHTRESLTKLVENASLHVSNVYGIQRYPLANHLYWLAHNKPGGHDKWSFLSSEQLEKSYESILDKNDLTDTLILECSK